jgi:hypothetical protein
MPQSRGRNQQEPLMTATRPIHGDDFAVWPDGSWATIDEVRSGECSWKSDDFEIVPLEDELRLQQLGLADEIDLTTSG